jgi:hypothetical protein
MRQPAQPACLATAPVQVGHTHRDPRARPQRSPFPGLLPACSRACSRAPSHLYRFTGSASPPPPPSCSLADATLPPPTRERSGPVRAPPLPPTQHPPTQERSRPAGAMLWRAFWRAADHNGVRSNTPNSAGAPCRRTDSRACSRACPSSPDSGCHATARPVTQAPSRNAAVRETGGSNAAAPPKPSPSFPPTPSPHRARCSLRPPGSAAGRCARRRPPAGPLAPTPVGSEAMR